MDKITFRNKLAQENFDYYVWNGHHINENDLLYRLYKNDFSKSEAKRAITFIYNQTIKAFNK